MIEAAREKIASWIKPRRDEPIDFGPGYTSRYFGSGLGSNQPPTNTLLRENLGVSAMATRAIANRIGSLDPQVKTSVRQQEGTIKDEVLDDHILKALIDRPHPNYSRFQLLSLAAHHIVTAGEAYWLKVRNRMRVPMLLQPMPPGKVAPQVTDGVISGYVVQDTGGNSISLMLDEVIRFWFPDPETMYSAEGYLGPNAAVADGQKFADQHLRSHYQSDATPPIILKASVDAAEPTVEQRERFQEAWLKKYAKRTGTHRAAPAFLPTGWDAIIGAMASGADVTPLLDHWQSNQLMNFGVPSSILGRVVSGDRSSAETNQFVFDLHTITPIATMIADTLTLQLAGDFDPNIWVEFDEFVSGDKDYELRREAQDLDKKIKTVQQVLIDRGDDPGSAPWGELPVGTLADTPYTGEEREFPSFGSESTTDIEDPPDDTEEEPELAPGEEDESQRKRASRDLAAEMWTKPLSMARVMNREKKFTPPFGRALRRVFKKQNAAVKTALNEYRSRALPADSAALFDPAGWDELFDLETQAIREEAYLFSARESLALLGIVEDFSFTDTVAQTLRLQGAEMVKLVNRTTIKRIQKALQAAQVEGDSLDDLTKAIDEIFKGRRRNSATIARTEMHRATQAGQLESFVQAEVPFKTWLDARDASVRETHFQEGILPARMGDDFILPSGYRCQYPSDSRLPAAESVNCRCDAAPVFGVGDEVPGG
jgi:hypothetical protein